MNLSAYKRSRRVPPEWIRLHGSHVQINASVIDTSLSFQNSIRHNILQVAEACINVSHIPICHWPKDSWRELSPPKFLKSFMPRRISVRIHHIELNRIGVFIFINFEAPTNCLVALFSVIISLNVIIKLLLGRKGFE